MIRLRPGLGATDYTSTVSSLAPSYGVPPSLALAVMQKESAGNPAAVSSAGAIGLFQLMPGTAAGLGVDPHDPTQNIKGGLTYLSQLYNQYGDWNQALIAYNEGPGTLAHGTIYPSSQSYADSILAAANLPADTSTDSSSSDTSSFSFSDLTAGLPDLSSAIDLPALTGLSWPILGGIFGVLVITFIATRR